MELSGAEILILSLADRNIDTIFGYPGSCVMQILDNLFDNKRIRHILVRHEQSATHAACGYARMSNKPGVVLVTSGPGATNTITGIADAFSNEIPLLVITGQVSSGLLGSDAFQEADMINLTASITKWNYQIRCANEIVDAVSKAFKIAVSGRPGPVLLDITKDAQWGKARYNHNSIESNYSHSSINHSTILQPFSENLFYAQIIRIFHESRKDILLVMDQEPNRFYLGEYFCSNLVIRSERFNVPGSGLPAAIGVKYAAPDKTVCLVTGCMEFQSAMKELGTIKQQGIDVKVIILNDSQKSRFEIKNPDFMELISAYDIQGEKIDQRGDLTGGILRLLNSAASYLLEINECRAI